MNEKTKLPFAQSFRDLIVYQRQRELARRVFEVTKKFPSEERFSLTDQIRRASRSVGAQIAEAWGKREYVRHFVTKLTDADAERQETEHWIETATDCAYLDKSQATELLALCAEIGRMLHSMRNRAAAFCPTSSTLREDPPISDFPNCELNTEY
jgi:four helix bundle protein